MNVETLLHEVITDELNSLKELEVGSKEYTDTVDGVAKLCDRAIEMEKIGIEHQKMDEDRKDRWIKNGIAFAGIVIPVGVTIWGTLKSFKFEETGTITTIMGRGFINKLLPKK